MDFTFTPDWEADLPLYEQIYRYAVAEIRAGRLAEGDKLPSRRRLAEHLGVSLTTVERAYGLLYPVCPPQRLAGLSCAHAGRGCSAQPPPRPPEHPRCAPTERSESLLFYRSGGYLRLSLLLLGAADPGGGL